MRAEGGKTDALSRILGVKRDGYIIKTIHESTLYDNFVKKQLIL